MSPEALLQLRQRADYTHQHNIKTGRHGWLRLTPAYSVKVVEEVVATFDGHKRILDPFCGTATTALSAAYHRHEGVTTDINPFLVWLGEAKTAHYSVETQKRALQACTTSVDLCLRDACKSSVRPPIHNIERWWSEEALVFLCKLKGAILEASKADSQVQTLLLIAFCRTLIKISNASFNHQSMSFKTQGQSSLPLVYDMTHQFTEDVVFILRGAADNPEGTARVSLGDSRNLASYLEGEFDSVITSPPYVNRMSYIRELRPYMYWLNFLSNGREAGELDWSAIGGTWGVATSRLADWTRDTASFENAILANAVKQIACAENKNGPLLANYVAKYFDDMWNHFQGLTPLLTSGAELHYIVGNSTFYGVLLPVEQLYASMLRELGFTNVDCRPLRKRNSKKELVEFDVTAKWRRG